MNATSTSRVVSRYAAANGNAVFTQLSGRDAVKRSMIALLRVSVGIGSFPHEVPDPAEEQDPGDRIGEVLDRSEAEADAPDVRIGVVEQAGRDHDRVEHDREHDEHERGDEHGEPVAVRSPPPPDG